ncbi:MAG: DUF86 domain-containing protein [candidate division NC10 bacterium]|nr:DUF86 domain-containing protein [candidate division NC10 bacterium]
MKPRREIADYLRDILDAIQKIERFIGGMDFARFAADEKTVFAVIRALEIVGEAARNVPKAVQSRYPTVPSREMSGIRDKLAHGYFRVNLEVIWKTIHEDLPGLRVQVDRVLTDMTREKGQA